MLYLYCRDKGETMLDKIQYNKFLWMTMMIFITYLLVGSFVEGRNIWDLIYLIVLYLFLILYVIKGKKK